jgi:hypothetical protein
VGYFSSGKNNSLRSDIFFPARKIPHTPLPTGISGIGFFACGGFFLKLLSFGALWVLLVRDRFRLQHWIGRYCYDHGQTTSLFRTGGGWH